MRSLWGVLDGLVSGVLHRIRLSDLIGTDGTVVLNLRHHLEATIDNLLGSRNGSAVLPLPTMSVEPSIPPGEKDPIHDVE